MLCLVQQNQNISGVDCVFGLWPRDGRHGPSEPHQLTETGPHPHSPHNHPDSTTDNQVRTHPLLSSRLLSASTCWSRCVEVGHPTPPRIVFSRRAASWRSSPFSPPTVDCPNRAAHKGQRLWCSGRSARLSMSGRGSLLAGTAGRRYSHIDRRRRITSSGRSGFAAHLPSRSCPGPVHGPRTAAVVE